MNTTSFIRWVIVAFSIAQLYANPETRRAAITGGGGSGRCTIEVNVDGTAELEISGDTGILRTISGRASQWRRFQCNDALSRDPADFEIGRVSGRGDVSLLRDPRSNRGVALIRIRDPRGGRQTYAFDIYWRESRGGWTPAPPLPGPGRGSPGNPPIQQAIRICQDSVSGRLSRDGFRPVTFERIVPDDRPGRDDWINGTVVGQRRFETARFRFACSVDLRAGTVRSVDVRPW